MPPMTSPRTTASPSQADWMAAYMELNDFISKVWAGDNGMMDLPPGDPRRQAFLVLSRSCTNRNQSPYASWRTLVSEGGIPYADTMLPATAALLRDSIGKAAGKSQQECFNVPLGTPFAKPDTHGLQHARVVLKTFLQLIEWSRPSADSTPPPSTV